MLYKRSTDYSNFQGHSVLIGVIHFKLRYCFNSGFRDIYEKLYTVVHCRRGGSIVVPKTSFLILNHLVELRSCENHVILNSASHGIFKRLFLSMFIIVFQVSEKYINLYNLKNGNYIENLHSVVCHFRNISGSKWNVSAWRKLISILT